MGDGRSGSAVRFRQEADRRDVIVDVCRARDLRFSVETGNWLIKTAAGLAISDYDAAIARTLNADLPDILTVARLLRELGKIVIDDELADPGYTVSKLHDYILLARNGIPVPDTWKVQLPRAFLGIVERLGFPLILKGIYGMQGAQTFLIESFESLQRTVALYPDNDFLLQEFLPATEDFRLLVIGYRSLPLIVKRKLQPGEFLTNTTARATHTALKLKEMPRLGELAEKASRILRREIAGVDIRFSKEIPMVLEVNRNPSFTDFENTTNLNVANVALEYVIEKCARARKAGIKHQAAWR